MFYHKNLAVEGLDPTLFSARSIANLGTYEIEVIIAPVSNTGGGWLPTPIGSKPDRYKVTVTVKHNGKNYIDEQLVTDFEARVAASLYGITKFSEIEPTISINGIQIFNIDK